MDSSLLDWMISNNKQTKGRAFCLPIKQDRPLDPS